MCSWLTSPHVHVASCSLQPNGRQIGEEVVQKIDFDLTAGTVKMTGLKLHVAARSGFFELQLESAARRNDSDINLHFLGTIPYCHAKPTTYYKIVSLLLGYIPQSTP